MQFLTKEAIKNAPANFKVERVDVPEWEGFVYVREISAHARDVFEDSTFELDPEHGKVKLRSLGNRRALFVVLTACDEGGSLIFDLDDIEWLGEKQLKAVDRIYTAAQKLNGMTVEDAEKNSETPAEGSSSD